MYEIKQFLCISLLPGISSAISSILEASDLFIISMQIKKELKVGFLFV